MSAWLGTPSKGLSVYIVVCPASLKNNFSKIVSQMKEQVICGTQASSQLSCFTQHGFSDLPPSSCRPSDWRDNCLLLLISVPLISGSLA